MKNFKAHYMLIPFLLLVLNTKASAWQEFEPKEIVKSIKHTPGYDLFFEADWLDHVKIKYWDKDSIRITAQVDLLDAKGKNKNDNYALKVSRSRNQHVISAKVKNNTAHYIFQKSGSDFDPKTSNMYKADKALRVGTQIEIYVPKNINVEFKTDMGSIDIEHNGGGLLVSTKGVISLTIDPLSKANLKLSTYLGEILVANGIELKEEENVKRGFKVISGNDGVNYTLNGGGAEISLVTMGDIKIVKAN